MARLLIVGMNAPLILDSITVPGADARGRAALAASHGGIYAAYLAAKVGLKAVIFNDAGVGRERAGIAGLGYLERLGMPAATVGHRTARIGDGNDCAARGIITFVNANAAAVGVSAEMSAREALDRLAAANIAPALVPSPLAETRHRLKSAEAPGVQVLALDSASLMTPEDAGHVVLAASHGALLGGRPEAAIKVAVFAAIYNDADRGIDDAGISRLPALEARGIAAACVSAWSARIGDGMSTYRDGFVSALNKQAVALGGEIGMPASELTARLVAARHAEINR